MKVVLIGASGFVGSAVLHELLQRGHYVTAITRNAGKLQPANNLAAISVDVLNEVDVANVLAGHDAVISAYNAGWQNPNLYKDFLKGSQAIQSAVKKAGIKRLIVVGGAGSLFIAPGQQLVDTEGFPDDWKPGALAARDYLNILKQERELDWTFLSPAIEMHPGTSGKRLGTYRTGLDNPVTDTEGRSVISVEDVAVAVADELEHPKHIQQRFTVAY
ncbi:MAG TPA: NAD(P)-dependent oxidoreductase [Parafilimonas sp.]|nr:NAD(P)-dependent oxidoreductase [Parafilimonas sp.]